MKRFAGVDEAALEVRAEASVADLLNGMSKMFGSEFRSELFNDAGAVNPMLVILLDGVAIDKKSGLHTGLKAGEIEMAMFPMMEGG